MTICSSCKEECSEVEIKDGFYYDYGSITGAWHDESYAGSSCCGEPILEGKVFFEKSSVHTARKDHKNRKGEITIHKGDIYRSSLTKGYYIDDGVHEPIYEYSKRVIQRKKDVDKGEWIYHKKSWHGRWECGTCGKKYFQSHPKKCHACKEAEELARQAEENAMSLLGEVEV
jgi:hypothetical protein